MHLSGAAPSLLRPLREEEFPVRAIRRNRLLFLGLLLLVWCGCRESSDPAGQPPYTQLPATMARTDPQLRQELAQLQQQRQLPWQWATASVPPTDNAAKAIFEIAAQDDVAQAAAEAAAILPTDDAPLSLTTIEMAAELSGRHAATRNQAFTASLKSECSFGVDPAEGLIADLDFIAAVRLAVRLEGLAAIGRLAIIDRPESNSGRQANLLPVEANFEPAIDSVESMFRWAAWLAQEPHVTCRLEAVHLRTEAFRVLERLAQHPQISQEQMQRLAAAVERDLADWPSDADTARLDRIVGLQTYELIRAGQLDLIFTTSEDAPILMQRANAIRKLKPEQIDRDQRFYLQHVRDLIQSSTGPWPARKEFIDRWLREGEARRTDGDYPIIALEVVLRDAQPMHKLFTFDRARSEAWSLALATAAGQTPPTFKTSPATGEDYRVIEREQHIAVWGHGGLGDDGERPAVARRAK